MKKSISSLLAAGLLIFVAYEITQRFITAIPDWVAIPLLVTAIVLIIMGGKTNKKK